MSVYFVSLRGIPPSHRSLIRPADAENRGNLTRAPANLIYEVSEPKLDDRWIMAREIATEGMRKEDDNVRQLKACARYGIFEKSKIHF